MMKVIITTLIIVSSLFAKAQSNIRLMDLGVMPLMYSDSITPNDSIEYLFSFKINDAASATQLTLKLGSDQELSDVKEITATIEHDGGGHYILYNSEQYPIKGLEAQLVFKLATTQLSNANVYTLYVTDDEGLETIHYYLNN